MEIAREHSLDDVPGEESANEPGSAPRRRFPLAVWLIVALQTMLMLGMTVLYPSFQSPDEIAHIDYVLAHRHGEWFDRVGERVYQAGVLAANEKVPPTQFSAHVGGGTVVPRSARKSFDALGTGSSSPFPNQMVQHPPLYYGLAAGFSYLLPDFSHQRFDIQIFWLRLLSVLLLVPVPLLIYGAAMRATQRRSVALVAAIIPLSMPIYLRTGASVNNDALLTLLTVVTAALLVRIAWGDLSRRTALLLGLAWGAALLTKGFALGLPPAIVLAYLLGTNGSLRDRIRASWVGIVLSGAIGFGIGGWWWIRNEIVYGSVQPNGLGKLSDHQRQVVFGGDRPGGSDLDLFGNFFRLLGQRLWGSLGQVDQPSIAHRTLFILAVSFLLTLVAALVAGTPPLRARLEGSGWTAGRAASLILPALLTLGVMYVGSRSTYVRTRQLSGIQARYVIPDVLGLAICSALALHLVARRWRHWLPFAALVGGLAFLARSVYQVLDVEMSSLSPDRYQRLKDALHFLLGWAAFPSVVTVAMLTLTFALAVTTLVVLALGAPREAADAGPARVTERTAIRS